MNTGQMLLAIGALFILSLLILNINNSFSITGDVMISSKQYVLATSIGTSILEEAMSQAFDESTVNSVATSESQFVTHANLKKESGEVYPYYDDIDDYNNFTRNDSLETGTFNLSCVVSYVNPTTPEISVTSKTWFKKIVIYVTSNTMMTQGVQDTLKFSSIFSYWN